MKKQNIILLMISLLLAVVPLFLVQAKNGEELFAGADGQAEALIQEIQPDYQPWFTPFWEPPSGEVESLLFGLQAAVGALAIGYCLGFYRGKRKGEAGLP